jgi:hypothetical protein
VRESFDLSVDEVENLTMQLRSRRWLPEEYPIADQWLTRNADALELIEAALDREAYYSPLLLAEDAPLTTADGQHSVYARQVSELLASRAMRRLGEGNYDGAWSDLLRLYRLSSLLSARANMVEYLVSCAIEAIAFDASVEFVRDPDVSTFPIGEWRNQFDRTPQVRDFAEVFAGMERLIYLESASRIIHDHDEAVALFNFWRADAARETFAQAVSDSAVDWDQSLQVAANWFDEFSNALKPSGRTERLSLLRDAAARLQDVRFGLEDSESLAIRVQSGSPGDRGAIVGEMIACQLLPFLEPVQDAEHRMRVRHELTRLALALLEYQSGHGDLPRGLDELLPGYIPALPVDPFSEAQLIYRLQPDGALVYSVGANGLDDEGRGRLDEPPGDDSMIRIGDGG